MRETVDLLLLTALAEEEQVVETVLELTGARVKRRDHLALYDYPVDDKIYRVAATSAYHQGAVAMGVFASSILAELKPDCVALVGIAAAVDLSEVGLGDVPCTELVLSYDDIKVRRGKLTLRPSGLPPDPILFRAVLKIQSPQNHDLWQATCQELIESVIVELNKRRSKRRPNKQIKLVPNRRPPQIVAGITGAGPFLLQDADFRDALREERHSIKKYSRYEIDQPLHPKLISAEMESHGFMQAAAFRRVPAIVLKGIADPGDESKTRLEKLSKGFFRTYACSNAVITALHMLRFRDGKIPSPVREMSMWELVGEYASNVFTWGNPIVVHGDAEQYASFAQSLLDDPISYVLWTVNGSPLDIAEGIDANHLTAWDRKFRSVQCQKRRLVVFRTEKERHSYITTRGKHRLARRKAFQAACGEALYFTSVPELHAAFPGLTTLNGKDKPEDALDIGFVSTDSKGLCFYSPFATHDLGKPMPTSAPIVLFSTDVDAPDPHGNDHKESRQLLKRLHAYRHFIGMAIRPNSELSWLHSDASTVPKIPTPSSKRQIPKRQTSRGRKAP